jgi:hypothetical protein
MTLEAIVTGEGASRKGPLLSFCNSRAAIVKAVPPGKATT